MIRISKFMVFLWPFHLSNCSCKFQKIVFLTWSNIQGVPKTFCHILMRGSYSLALHFLLWNHLSKWHCFCIFECILYVWIRTHKFFKYFFLKYLSRFDFFCVTNSIFMFWFKISTGISKKKSFQKHELIFKCGKCIKNAVFLKRYNSETVPLRQVVSKQKM